jgi:hypothetical protein
MKIANNFTVYHTPPMERPGKIPDPKGPTTKFEEISVTIKLLPKQLLG